MAEGGRSDCLRFKVGDRYVEVVKAPLPNFQAPPPTPYVSADPVIVPTIKETLICEVTGNPSGSAQCFCPACQAWLGQADPTWLIQNQDTAVLEVVEPVSVPTEPVSVPTEPVSVPVAPVSVFRPENPPVENPITHDPNDPLSIPINRLGLSDRCYDRCKALGVRFVGELVQKSCKDFKALKGRSKKKLLEELEAVLAKMGLQLGIMITDWVAPPVEPQYRSNPIQPTADYISLAENSVTPLEEGMAHVFARYNLPRLGGASGDWGWSSFSTFMRCPYSYKRNYLDGIRGGSSSAFEVGSCGHAYLAVYYQGMIEKGYPLTPELLYQGLLDAGCAAESVMEAWRCTQGYFNYYDNDYITPVAVEYHVVDPITRESCRYDAIAHIDSPASGYVPGAYVIEHKFLARFDDAALTGYQNDGEVLGQITLWRRLKLDRKFGKLQGVLMNLVGKQKVDQRFYRTAVPIQHWQVRQHTEDLQRWGAFRDLCRSLDIWPRARANCIGRWGKCVHWTHCADYET